MKVKLVIILLAFQFVGFGQNEEDLTSFLPKYAPEEVMHRNKIDDNGKKWGVWQYYSRSGVLILEITYKNNLRDGAYTRYNGVTGNMIEKGNYLNGIKNGSFTKWFSNGEKRVEGTYAQGRKTDLWSYYYKTGSGALRMTGKFKDGKKHGFWIFYEKGGSIRKKVKFQEGQLVTEK